jgi:hypothetical protein
MNRDESPPRAHPYYIAAPAYTRMSAGVKVLHRLCRSLNERGQRAYMISKVTSPELATPVLTRELERRHLEEGTVPIVVYSEVVAGNPLGAACAARYLLAAPPGSPEECGFAASELRVAYSTQLLLPGMSKSDVLFLPVSDANFFSPPPAGAPPRRGTCFYAYKYRSVAGGELFAQTRDSVEIRGASADAQTPEELVALFRRSELFYCYENSSLALEARLCGCPSVMLPNRYFKSLIGQEELGADGIAWGTAPEEIRRARETVGRAREGYLAAVERFWIQLDGFIASSQAKAAASGPARPLNRDALVFLETPGEKLRAAAIVAREQLRESGIRALLAKTVRAYSAGGAAAVSARMKRAFYRVQARSGR